MNIFKGLKLYAGKDEEEYLEIDDTGKNSKGVYMNDYTCQSYTERCYQAASLSEDVNSDID